MKKLVLGELGKKIKNSNITKIFRFKTEISNLNTKISDLEREKQKLNDLIESLKQDNKHLKNNDIKVASMEVLIERIDTELKKKLETIKKQTQKIKELNKRNDELETQKFTDEQEIKRWKIQSEEYERQIEDLHTEGRYLVKKVKPGRKPNTIKTKISKPMASNVVKYMRGEHE